MRLHKYQAGFNKGQLSPALFGRTDIDSMYSQGAEEVTNAYVMPQGGLRRREGLEYIATTTSSAAGRLVSFEFNTEQKYLLVFTAGEMKVYKDDVLQATITSSPISTLTAAMVAEMKWTQSADTLYLVHEDVQPIKVTRASHTSWSASSVTFSNIPTYDYGSGAEAVISATRGWPRSIAFKYGRLWLGGQKSRPQTILSSKVGDFEDLDEGTALDDEALNVTIDDDRVNAITDMFPTRNLEIYTSGGVFVIRGQLGDPVTPSQIAEQLQKQVSTGSNGMRPVSIDGDTLYIEKGGYVVRSFSYDDIEGAYLSEDVTVYSPEVIVTPVRMDFRTSSENFPSPYCYIVNSDGSLAVLSYVKTQKIIAWSKFETEGDFEDVATVGSDVYFICKRTVNSVTVRYIEKLNVDRYTDASVYQNNGSPKSSWGGLSVLEGVQVSLRGDDYKITSETVASGAITTDENVTILEAGFGFNPSVKTMPLDSVISSSGRQSQGKYKGAAYVDIRMKDTRTLQVNDGNNTYEPPFRTFGANVLDQPASTYSGWKRIFISPSGNDAQITITQDAPLEWYVLSYNIAMRY
jgi:hypothetical protein